ncbi:hypothetical protein J4Q44_G00000850 [Coregonus suidteri]|uniref:PLAC domain-containing protein n=1 Tax=Coregonus suidteri TaxID=861788 RepID=A0AAN8MIQ1_9TELE
MRALLSWVIPQEEDTKISLTYKYIIHEDLLPVITNNNVLLAELDTYEWALKSWSQCSKPCGGGIQYTKYGCRRKSDSRLVHRNFCETSKKPKPIRKRCNVNECSQPTWLVEEWSPCSKTCGKLGYQSRVVQCMQALHNGTNRTVHTKYCTEDRPETRKVCNPSACPAQWRTGAWSQCSVRCGEGIQQRQVVCRATDNTIGQCEGDKPETVLICKLSPCPGQSSLPPFNIEAMENSTTKTEGVHQIVPENPVHKISSNEPCLGDKSIFCQMEVLARYCSIPGYNKLCCESCNKKEGFTTLFSPSPDLHKTGGSSDSETGPDQETSTQPNPTASTTLPSDTPLPHTTTQSPPRTTKTPRRPRSTAQGLTTSPSAGAVPPKGPSLGVGDGDSVPVLPSLPPGPSPPLRPRLRPNAAPDSNGDPALSPSKEHSSPNNRSLGQAAGPGPEPGPAGAVAGVAAARSRREDVGSERDSAHRTRTTRTMSHVVT